MLLPWALHTSIALLHATYIILEYEHQQDDIIW
jgi:hypothetical protein